MTIQIDQETEELRREIVTISPYLNDPVRTDFTGFLETFGENFSRFTEISISPHDSSIGLMTKGKGHEFDKCVRNHLRTGGVTEKGLRFFDEVTCIFPEVSFLVKHDFAEEPLFDFSLYWQHLVPAKLFIKLARKMGFPKEALEGIHEYELLTRNRTFYMGMSITPPDTVQFRIFFSNNLEKCSAFIAPGLAALMARLKLDANSINYFISFHNYLVRTARGSIFTSIGFNNSGPVGLKVDYEVIPPEYAIEMMKSLDLSPDEGLRMARTMKTLGMRNLTYLGIRFLPDRKPTVKFYYDRRFSEKNRDNPKILADIVQNTIWIP